MSTLPPEMRAEVLAAVRRTPSPDVGARRRTNVAAVALGVATAVVMVATMGVSLGGRPAAFVALSAAGWALLAAAATAMGGRGRSMLGRTSAVLVVVAIAIAPAIYAWVMGCTAGWPEVREPPGTWHNHLGCLFVTTMLSLGPVVALAVIRRGIDAVHPRATGAAAFAAAGAWGGVLIDMHCPLVSPLHVAIGHVLPVLLYAAVGALLGARLFGVAAKR